MRRMLVVLVWVVATVGVTYVANAAVELVDLQVFPQGARIEVLARAQPTPTTLPRMRATTTTTTTAAETTTMAAVTTTAAEVIPPPTSMIVATTAAPTTTVVTVVTTTVLAATPVSTTAPPEVTTTRPPTTTMPPVTTTRPPATTTTTAPVAPVAPVLPLVVVTGSLPEARVGESYQATLAASGGTGPYSWNLAVGTLPDGLDLSEAGVLSGIPSSSSLFTLVFNVSDTDGQSASSAELVFETAADRRTVAARGGTVFVDLAGDSVSLFLASPADGFSAVIVESGGFRVEVQFVPQQGDATSWVVCEVAGGVVCTHG